MERSDSLTQVSHTLYLSKPLNGKGQNKFGSFTALTLIEIQGAKLESLTLVTLVTRNFFVILSFPAVCKIEGHAYKAEYITYAAHYFAYSRPPILIVRQHIYNRAELLIQRLVN